jgi:glycosyltransferase involved in cell wall biosynthesis
MKIGIDARIYVPVPSGMGRYALNLLKSISSNDSKNEYFVFKHISIKEPIVNKENFHEISLRWQTDSFVNIFFGSKKINSFKLDIFHSLYPMLPYNINAKYKILTLHDLGWIDYPHLLKPSTSLHRFFGKHFMKIALGKYFKKADYIIAVSESTRASAINNFNLSPNKIKTIYLAADQYPQKYSLNELPDKLKDKRYILSLGNTNPHKNVMGILKAFKILSTKHPEIILVIVGRGDTILDLNKLISRLKLNEKIFFFQSIPDKIMLPILKNALLLAFPSFYEGFGLPILEAMTLGCPVLTSNVSAPSEIAGDAAIKVNPWSVEEIASGMEKIITDTSLREKLIQKGYEHANRFSWDKVAKETLKVYQKFE